MSLEAENAVSRFMQDRQFARNSRQMDGSYGPRIYSGYAHPATGSIRPLRLYSYGPHFLVAERDNNHAGYWVTEARYQTGEWKVSGKPKYSPTTDKHIREATRAIANVANRTDVIRHGWHGMPRYLNPDDFPMRFYLDRTSNRLALPTGGRIEPAYPEDFDSRQAAAFAAQSARLKAEADTYEERAARLESEKVEAMAMAFALAGVVQDASRTQNEAP